MGKASNTSGAKVRPVVVAATTGKKSETAVAKISDFSGACKWLLERVDVERLAPTREVADALKLGRMERLMAVLGNPHREFKSVHVAGTKGKGSTCEMTAAALEACGYTVGLYTSPHLADIRERIRLNRSKVSEGSFVELARRVAEAERELSESDGDPTFFELITAMAFCHFADQAVDAAVIEVGLGGRLDSTNVITPSVCVITSISLDHTQILGNTIEKIAKEKAGIFKPGVAAVSAPQKPGVVEVLRAEAARVGAGLKVLGAEIEFSTRFDAAAGGRHGGGGTQAAHMRVSVGGGEKAAMPGYEHVAVPMRGEHQALNCGVALAALAMLQEQGFRLPEEKVTAGLETVFVPGRLEVVKSSPRVVLDGAHNAESVMWLMKTLSGQMARDSMVVVFGCAADKDVDGMLREMAGGADKVIFTKSDNARAADPKELAKKFTEMSGKMCQTAPNARAAMELAKKGVGREDLICVTGSLYLVAEVRGLLGLK
jgi:dihydrofolate synthase/folylpolyglutamate synthase